MAEEVNDLEFHKHCIIIISVIKSLMVFLKNGRGKCWSHCSLMLRAALYLLYLLNSLEARDVKLHVEMRLADQ